MTRKFGELKAQVEQRPGARERIDAHKRRMIHELALGELRRARLMTQEQLANALEIKQSGVSRIEHETDLYLSTLRSYVEALGGRLEIHAVFADGEDIAINSVEELEGDHSREPQPA